MSETKSKDEDLVEVSWTGRKLLIKRSLLDGWYHQMSYEEKVQYVKEHPYAEQPVNVHTFKPLKDMKIEKILDPEDYVLITWAGSKVLMIPKDFVEEWYASSYEQHLDYVEKHPDCVIEESS